MRTDLEQLAAEDLFKMQSGDTFRVYWCKDDNPEDCRLDYDLMVVASNKDGTITCQDYSWEFYTNTMTDDPQQNILDTSRGYCYLFKTGTITAEEMMVIIHEAEHQIRHETQYDISQMYCEPCKKSAGPQCESCKTIDRVANAILPKEMNDETN